MITINRKDVRKELAKFLAVFMKSAVKVYSYQVSDFKKASPVVYITSSGSGRERLTGRGLQSEFKFNVHSFVLYADEKSKWTEEMAEALLDDLEFELAEAVTSLRDHPFIKGIGYNGESNADGTAIIGGETYLHEITPIKVICFM